MDMLKRSHALKPLAAMIAAAALATPGVAAARAATTGRRRGRRAWRPARADLREAYPHKYERRYIEVRRKVIKRWDADKAGRNIVRDGVDEKNGGRPRGAQGRGRRVDRADAGLDRAGAGDDRDRATATTTAAAAGAPTSVIECESGGDYGAVNPAGYYGAYQFDQGTWDAYAPEGYAGTNPASAPPAVQDAAAAAVPYDAWPNC